MKRCLFEFQCDDETEKVQQIYGHMTARVSRPAVAFHIYSCPPPHSFTVRPLVFSDSHGNWSGMDKSHTETILLF